MASSISAGEKKFVAEGIAANVRIDGRSRLEYRDLILETDLLPQCHGSARATIPTDNTDVLASVKVEIDAPDADCNEDGSGGSIDVSASIWASSSAALATGGGRAADDFSALLTRTLQTIIVDSNVIDRRSLCILKGKFVWRVFVDILVLDAGGGNLVDTAVIAALAALADTKLPKLRLYRGETEQDWDLEVEDDPFAFTRLPGVDNLPLAITFTQAAGGGRFSIVDALPEEEACADSRVIVGVNRAGSIVSVVSDGTSGIEPSSLHACLEAAEKIAPVLFARIDNSLGATAGGAGTSASSSSASALLAAIARGNDRNDGADALSRRGGRGKQHAAGSSMLADRGPMTITKANQVKLEDEDEEDESNQGKGAGNR